MIRESAQTAAAAPAKGIFDFTPESLRVILAGWNEPAYRADQVLRWVYSSATETYEQMSNVPAVLRAKLAAEVPIYQSNIANRQESADGTIKLLLAWADGTTTECVLIPDEDRRTACISTQVGCPVGCVFCASGLDGLERNLTAGQIIEQVMRVRQCQNGEGLGARGARLGVGAEEPLDPRPEARASHPSSLVPHPSSLAAGALAAVGGNEPRRRLTNIVFMGLGEPLANYDATLQAIRTINADWGMGIGARKITVSTVGLPKQMRQLADEKLQINLALSLHAPNDELRQKLIPWAKGIDIASLVEAANYYFQQTGREITLEYILLGGLNDFPAQAAELARVSKKMRSNVNLIAYNPVPGLPYARPTADAIRTFVAALRERGVNAHVRRSRGLDIDSACGQLRRRMGEPVRLNAAS